MRTRAVQATLIIAVLIALSGFASAQLKPPPVVPQMKLQGLDGKVYDLADLRGSVVLVSFGATWCAPCITELKALQELLSEFRDKPVKFFWVSVERPEEITNAGLKRYAHERRVTFPVLRDTGKIVYLQFADRVRLPMIVLLKKDGRVDAPVQLGMSNPAESYKANLRARISKLLTNSGEAEQ
jgi:peroxiredoxin